MVGAAEIVCRSPVRPAGEGSGDVGPVNLVGFGMENGITLESQDESVRRTYDGSVRHGGP
ncbi:hypothetical protein A0W34_31090 (plasmid) [Rhodococcus sp. BH4]|nr:hypothetical protein A0W34_31090 [Rhodococcus sp. BH4]